MTPSEFKDYQSLTEILSICNQALKRESAISFIDIRKECLIGMDDLHNCIGRRITAEYEKNN